ncbi:MAG TPA: LytTR family DNA-binding domain-containing protein [Flavilitoribacter sp.]|nr:LytTR family DNA-binding domain-containing protein [Flavilitoribacter sp.]
MKLLIVEDEPIIARRIRRLSGLILGDRLEQITVFNSLEGGLSYLEKHEIDLLLLDLNLNGASGFDLLETMVAKPFHTIIISAYTDKAIRAFEYGVLDFVPKPFNQERLAQAFGRLQPGGRPFKGQARYLAVQKRGRHVLFEILDLAFIKGAGVYAELHFQNGSIEIHNKSLDALSRLLPDHFDRIHKSYIVNSTLVRELMAASGGKYTAVLKNGTELPISRQLYKELREKWGA